MLTTTITTETLLADVVTEYPSLARTLERLGFDYCCQGQRSIAVASAAIDLDPESVVRELVDGAVEKESADWAVMGPADLVDHVEHTHHKYVWDELPRLAALIEKIVAVHGANHPELADIQVTFKQLRSDFEPHMRKEELSLFPAIRKISVAETLPEFPFGSITNPISEMLSQHDETAVLLERLREQTNGFQAPADGCATYQATYAGLEEFERDTHLHVHKENNLLFPAVLRVEERLNA